MSTTETFLIAMLMIFAIPYLIWRVGRTDYYAPLAVVQTVAGVLLGPGLLGAAYPEYYNAVFNKAVIQTLNGIAWWAVMIFVMIAGVELDISKAWKHRRDTGITAGLALGVPFIFGCLAAVGMLAGEQWVGARAMPWQFVLGVGMACAVTALPILILLLEKLDIMREPIGQRILRYASADDIAVWGVLAVILLDWERIGREIAFLCGFALLSFAYRKLMVRLSEADRWYVSLIWLVACALASDWSGMHYMVGAFLAGAVTDLAWFDHKKMDHFRHNVLLAVMPVYFLSAGLKTNWNVGGATVLVAALLLMLISVAGKMTGVRMAGKILKWNHEDAAIIGWMLQTKGLVMIIFADILLSKDIIGSATFTALLLSAIGSTMLTVPMVYPRLRRLKNVYFGAQPQ